MDEKLISDEQWTKLFRAVHAYDQQGSRTALNQVLVPILQDVVESLDDYDPSANRLDDPADDEDELANRLVITLIEGELADIMADPACASWCCRRRRIRPLASSTHRFSDYLVNLARAKSLDPNNTGFLSREAIQTCFGAQTSEWKMAELMQFVEMNSDGHVNYRGLAALLLVS